MPRLGVRGWTALGAAGLLASELLFGQPHGVAVDAFDGTVGWAYNRTIPPAADAVGANIPEIRLRGDGAITVDRDYVDYRADASGIMQPVYTIIDTRGGQHELFGTEHDLLRYSHQIISGDRIGFEGDGRARVPVIERKSLNFEIPYGWDLYIDRFSAEVPKDIKSYHDMKGAAIFDVFSIPAASNVYSPSQPDLPTNSYRIIITGYSDSELDAIKRNVEANAYENNTLRIRQPTAHETRDLTKLPVRIQRTNNGDIMYVDRSLVEFVRREYNRIDGYRPPQENLLPPGGGSGGIYRPPRP
jgi:hypothetical protein